MTEEIGQAGEKRRPRRTLPNDVRHLAWAAEQLNISTSTAYRLAAAGEMPGAFRVGGQWRISVPRFLALVHGEESDEEPPEGPPRVNVGLRI